MGDKDLTVRRDAVKEQRFRVAEVKIADEVCPWPLLHPREEGLVGVTARELVDGLAKEEVVILGVINPGPQNGSHHDR